MKIIIQHSEYYLTVSSSRFYWTLSLTRATNEDRFKSVIMLSSSLAIWAQCEILRVRVILNLPIQASVWIVREAISLVRQNILWGLAMMTTRINLFWTRAAAEEVAMTDCVTSECEKQRENLDYYSCQFSFSTHCELFFFSFYAFWWWRWWSVSAASILSSLSYQLNFIAFFFVTAANMNSFLHHVSMLSENSKGILLNLTLKIFKTTELSAFKY